MQKYSTEEVGGPDALSGGMVTESQAGSARSMGRIGRLLSDGVKVLALVMIATSILRICSNLVLTRWLAPEVFGAVGILVAVSSTLTLATDMGFQAFVVRTKDAVSEYFLNVIWTIRLVRCVVLTAVVYAFGDVFAGLFDKPELGYLIRATAFVFLLEGAQSLYLIKAERDRRVAYVTWLEFAGFLLQIGVAVGGAMILQNIWCIIIGLYARGFFMLIASYVAFPGAHHKLVFDRDISKELWNFSRFVIVSSLMTIVLTQADKIFIGRALDLSTLGLYILAANLAAAGSAFIATYVSRILLPLYAEAFRDHPETLKGVYYSSRRVSFILLAFCIGGGVGGGQLIAQILFDERYLGAGLYISLLFLLPLGSLVAGPGEQAIIASGRVRSAVEANLCRLAWLVVAAPLGWHGFGVIGLVLAFALVEVVAAVYWWVLLHRFGIFRLREEAVIILAAVVGAGTGIASELLLNWLVDIGWLWAF